MATPDQPQKIRLQSVGWVPAVPASELKIGDQLMYNFGGTTQIVGIRDASPKFRLIIEVSTKTGEAYERRTKKTTLMARVPEHRRATLGKSAPTSHYRAQVRPPRGLDWITVGHGPTVEAATEGYQAEYFKTSILGNHGLGGSPDANEASIKAMADGETLTAEDGHSFRILPPEQPSDAGRHALMEAGHAQLGTLAEKWGASVDADAERLRAARPAVEGVVLPAGHTLGIPAEHADDNDARDARAALMAAGHDPALLSNQEDENGHDTARGTGFVIVPRGNGLVLVYQAVKGNTRPQAHTTPTLHQYRHALVLANWACDPFVSRAVRARRSSPLPEGVTVEQTRGETPELVKVRMTPQREALDRIRARADADREAHRAEMDEREAAEARAHGVPVRESVAARIAARQQVTRLAVGTRVKHSGQEWATSVVAPKGTAVVVGVGHTHHDGTVEYHVRACRDFSRRPGSDNPMDRLTEWNSARVKEVAPPRFEVRPISARQSGVWDADTELWVAVGDEERCRQDAWSLNTGDRELDAYGQIQR